MFLKDKNLVWRGKARVALAKVIAGRANFLLLDEPTNHLDMQSVELLIEALNQYRGTYLVVSHDRYFVSRTANIFWEIENKEVVSFKGSFDEWEEWKSEKALQQQPLPPKIKPLPQDKKPEDNAPSNAQRQKERELKKCQQAFQKVEAMMNQSEKQKAMLEKDLANPEIYSDKAKFLSTEQAYNKVLEALKAQQLQYDELFEKMLALENADS